MCAWLEYVLWNIIMALARLSFCKVNQTTSTVQCHNDKATLSQGSASSRPHSDSWLYLLVIYFSSLSRPNKVRCHMRQVAIFSAMLTKVPCRKLQKKHITHCNISCNVAKTKRLTQFSYSAQQNVSFRDMVWRGGVTSAILPGTYLIRVMHCQVAGRISSRNSTIRNTKNVTDDVRQIL